MTANVNIQEPPVVPVDNRNRYGLLARLSVPQKLSLVAGVLLLPLTALGVLHFGELTDEIRQVEAARLALPVADSANRFTLDSAEALSKAVEARRQRSALVPEAVRAADQSFSSYVAAAGAVPELGAAADTENFTRAWSVFKGALANPAVTTPELLSAYQTLISANLLQPLDVAPAAAGLSALSGVNPQLQAVVFRDLPVQELQLTEAYEQTRLALADATADRGPYLAAIDNVRRTLDSSSSTVQRALSGAQVEQRVSESYARYLSSAYAQTDAMEAALLGQDNNLAQATAAYREAAAGLRQAGVESIDSYLAAEVGAARTSLTLQTLLALLLIGLGAWLLWRIVNLISRAISTLTDGARKLSTGNYAMQVPIVSADEFAVLGRSFNGASQQLRQNQLRVEQERQQAQQLQQNIGEFLNVTMDIAEGDLTKRGKVTEDVLGNVVDSINLMADELGSTLKQVQQASQSVTGGSQQMLGATEQMEANSRTAAEQAQRLAARAAEINLRIQDMARSAQESAEAARQARETSEQGQLALQTTLQGMNQIREGTQNVAASMQSLAQRSRQIEEVVDTITQISSQINLLSLHASIEAAGAGEAGSRFSVVAEEVRRLADQTNEATGRIATMIGSVQTEIAEVVQSVQQNSQQVEEGYQIAGQASERLQELNRIAEQSALLAGRMSQVSTEQAQEVTQMGEGVEQIAVIARQAEQAVSQGRDVAQQMRQLAEQLNQSLGRFTLPS